MRASLSAVFAAHVLPSPAAADMPGPTGSEVLSTALEARPGDLASVLESKQLRMAIPYSPIYYTYDGEKFIGLGVEMARELENFMLEKLDTRVDVLLLPLPRNEILPAVTQGKADFAAANLTITPEREENFAFTNPVFTGISETVVTSTNGRAVTSFDDLVEIGLYLRPSSSYAQHLEKLNAQRAAEGRLPVPIHPVEPWLEDYDLLDMVNAGTIPATVVDSHKLELWGNVFAGIVIHEGLTLNDNGNVGWALHKDSVELLDLLNAFVEQVGPGTLIGNVLLQRYLGSSDWIETIRRGDDLEEYEKNLELIREYAGSYDLNSNMILAQAYQESRLDHSQESPAGAVGIMQVLPSTAADPNVAIPDIRTVENNVHAGVKYLRFIRDRYFDSPEISPPDAVFLSLAAYNAGPANIARARAQAVEMGLDPNKWFSNVELAAARVIGQEPVTYVRKIYKYFVAFSLLERREEERRRLNERAAGPRGLAAWWSIVILAAVATVAVLMAYLRKRRPRGRPDREQSVS